MKEKEKCKAESKSGKEVYSAAIPVCHVARFSLASCCGKLGRNEDGLGGVAEHPPGHACHASPSPCLSQEGPPGAQLSQPPREQGEPPAHP